MNTVLGFGSSADWFRFECAPEQDASADASPGVFGESVEVLHLVGQAVAAGSSDPRAGRSTRTPDRPGA
jgi:hypothetical protein